MKETSALSTLGTGQNTDRPIFAPRLASEYHATLAEGAPYVRDPGAAASLSATSAWTMTVAVSAHGRASNRVRRRGTARL